MKQHRKMKDSGVEWIGEIPEGWEMRKGRFIFVQRNERGNSLELQLLSPTQKYGVIPQSLYEELSGMRAVKLNETYDLSLLKTIHKGDYCISLRSFQGGFEYSEYEGVVSPAYQVFYPIVSIADGYYKHLFKDKSFIEKMNSYTMSLRDGKNIAFEDFGNTHIPYPSLDEQQKIADYLDEKCAKLDAVIEKQRASIEELKAYKLAVITEAVTKGLNPDVEMKDSGVEWIGVIPRNWEVRKAKAISDRLFVGVVIRPSEYFDDEGTIPFLRGINVKEYTINLDNLVYITEKSNASLSKSIVHQGDIVIVRDGNIGAACVVPESLAGSNVVSMIIMSPNSMNDSHFICYCLNSDIGKYQFEQTKIGSALTHTSVESVSKLQFAIPPLSEQKEIATYLNQKCQEIDTIIVQKQQLIGELTTYKKSLIYEVVTGKKEV